jgi:type II secretory pathway component GspD/PulD (secretin)
MIMIRVYIVFPAVNWALMTALIFHLSAWPLLSVLRRAAVAGALLLVFGAAHAQSTVLEVIPLRYRAAHEVIPIIQPLLPPEASVSGVQSQLVVRTTPANLEEIRRILASIDVAPRQLLITVRQDADISRQRSRAEVSGSVGGEHGRVTVPGGRETRGGNVVLRDGDDRVRANVQESVSTASDRNTQSVRVMEGREAYVSVGQSVPVRERQVRRTVVGGQVVEQVVEGRQYRDVATGFYVVPRITGDRVTLDVSPQRESMSRQVPGAVNVQSVTTTVSGRLGEWMEIGGLNRDASGQQTVILGRSTSATRDSRRVLVKVDEIR